MPDNNVNTKLSAGPGRRELSSFLTSRLTGALAGACPDRIFMVADTNTVHFTPALLTTCRTLAPTCLLTIPAGESNKNLTTVASLCDSLSCHGATRHSLIVNVGGGMVTDLGGFTASVFKRGIPYINIATTILAAVDAAIGGKTGGDSLCGPERTLLKNEIGAFHMPLLTISAAELFSSLPRTELLSGYGEILKTAMLHSRALYAEAIDAADALFAADLPADRIGPLTDACAGFKQDVTTRDPEERGLRRILNLGHTAGHAFESLLISLGNPLPHGVCVAHGLLYMLILSHICVGLPTAEIYRYRDLLRETFPTLPLSCTQLRHAITLMAHDKKNRAGQGTSFVLLRDIADPVQAFSPTRAEVSEAMDIFAELSH